MLAFQLGCCGIHIKHSKAFIGNKNEIIYAMSKENRSREYIRIRLAEIAGFVHRIWQVIMRAFRI